MRFFAAGLLCACVLACSGRSKNANAAGGGAATAGSNLDAGSVAAAHGGQTASSGGSGGAGTLASGRADGGAATAGQPSSACGSVLTQPRCLGSGFCWDGPGFEGGDLLGIDGTADAKSAWAVGALGTALHYCEGAWWAVDSGTEAHLYDVYSPSARFAAAVGSKGSFVLWDGQGFKLVPLPTQLDLRAVWGSAPNDLWIGAALGDDPMAETLFHFDGTKFDKRVATGNSVRAIRGRSPSDIYALGTRDLTPLVDHYDGTSWTQNVTMTENDPGLMLGLVFGPKQRGYGLFCGYSSCIVLTDDEPEWTINYDVTQNSGLSSLYLDDALVPSVVLRTGDLRMPGVAMKRDSLDHWTMSGDRFAATPTEAWTAAGKDFAVGEGAALLARGQDGVWNQVPEHEAMLGAPLFLGGISDTKAYYVSTYGVVRRDGSGWHALDRSSQPLTSASVDGSGTLYTLAQDGSVRAYDGTSWKDLPKGDPGQRGIYAIAPDDVWLTSTSLGQHFDGTAWDYSYKVCTGLQLDPSVVRKAPDGTLAGIEDYDVVAIDLGSKACTRIPVASGADAGASDPLADVAFTDDGKLWAVSQRGAVYRRDGSVMTRVLPTLSTESSTERARTLLALPGGKLRYLLWSEDFGEQRMTDTGRLVTVDTSSASSFTRTIEDAPVAGPLFTPDGHQTFVAFPGGVLRKNL